MRLIEAQLKAVKWEEGVPRVIGEVNKCYLNLSVYVGDKIYTDLATEENIILDECPDTGSKFYTGVVGIKNFRQYISKHENQERLLKWYADIFLFADYIFFEERWDEPPF